MLFGAPETALLNETIASHIELRRASAAHLPGAARAISRRSSRRPTGSIAETLTQGLVGPQLLVQHALFTLLPIAVELLTVVLVLMHFGHAGYLLIFVPTALAYLLVFRRAAARVMTPAG